MTTNASPWSTAQLDAHLTPPASLAVLATAGTPDQVRPTMAGAHLADVTTPQHRALAVAAQTGVVHRGGPCGSPVTVLRAAARKGLLDLHMRPGRRYDVSHATITARGRTELARLDAEQAAATTRRESIARVMTAVAA